MKIKKVGIADLDVSTNGTSLKTTGLGSCVGIALQDRETGVSGLAHIMLPSSDEVRSDNVAKFADSGLEKLVEDMEAEGADRRKMFAKIAGGSKMFEFSSEEDAVGRRNVKSVKEVLDEMSIPIIEEDTGGDYGRTVEFDPEDGVMTVKSGKKGTKHL